MGVGERGEEENFTFFPLCIWSVWNFYQCFSNKPVLNNWGWAASRYCIRDLLMFKTLWNEWYYNSIFLSSPFTKCHSFLKKKNGTNDSTILACGEWGLSWLLGSSAPSRLLTFPHLKHLSYPSQQDCLEIGNGSRGWGEAEVLRFPFPYWVQLKECRFIW